MFRDLENLDDLKTATPTKPAKRTTPTKPAIGPTEIMKSRMSIARKLAVEHGVTVRIHDGALEYYSKKHGGWKDVPKHILESAR